MKKFLLGCLALVVILVVVGFVLPSHWKVQRSVVISAPGPTIFPLVANFKSGWPRWSAFDDEDKDITYTYSGPEQGTGARRDWISKKMGDGHQLITKADAATGIEFELVMEQNQFKLNGRIAFEPSGSGTKVTWTDEGEVGWNPVYRYFGVFMDKFMGGTFEKSLTTLKQKAETGV